MTLRSKAVFVLFLIFFLIINAKSGVHAEVVFDVDFENQPEGIYDKTKLNADWNKPAWDNGIDEERVRVTGDLSQGKVLEVFYPRGAVGAGAGGAQWQLKLDKDFEELFVSYKVKFGENFDFVLGGKLPGLIGGSGNTGGFKPNGKDGWSGRLMWHPDGKVIQYVYNPDQPDIYGEVFDWKLGGQRRFVSGTWHTITNRIKMNVPGQSNGILQSWFGGELALDVNDMRYRDISDFGIDTFYFSTFFGGNDFSWAPSSDSYVYFDDFKIATSPEEVIGGVFSTPFPTAPVDPLPVCLGDFNLDQKVNLVDYSILSRNFFKDVSLMMASDYLVDMNQDGKVNIVDFSIFVRYLFVDC